MTGVEDHLNFQNKNEKETIRKLLNNNNIIIPLLPDFYEVFEKSSLNDKPVILPVDLIRDEKNNVLRQSEKFTSFMDFLIVKKEGKNLVITPVEIKKDEYEIKKANPGQTSPLEVNYLLTNYDLIKEQLAFIENKLFPDNNPSKRIIKEGFFLLSKKPSNVIDEKTIKGLENYLQEFFNEKKTIFVSNNGLLLQSRVKEGEVIANSNKKIVLQIISRKDFEREFEGVKRHILQKGFYYKKVIVYSDLSDYSQTTSFFYDPFTNELVWDEPRISALEEKINELKKELNNNPEENPEQGSQGAKQELRKGLTRIINDLQHEINEREGPFKNNDYEKKELKYKKLINRITTILEVDSENELVNKYFNDHDEQMDYSMQDYSGRITLLTKKINYLIRNIKRRKASSSEAERLRRAKAFLQANNRSKKNNNQSTQQALTSIKENAVRLAVKNYVSVNKSNNNNKLRLKNLFPDVNYNSINNDSGLEKLIIMVERAGEEIRFFKEKTSAERKRIDYLLLQKNYSEAKKEINNLLGKKEVINYAQKLGIVINNNALLFTYHKLLSQEDYFKRAIEFLLSEKNRVEEKNRLIKHSRKNNNRKPQKKQLRNYHSALRMINKGVIQGELLLRFLKLSWKF